MASKRDALCVGISVADTVGRPVSSVPAWGKLEFLESIGLFGGGCAMNTAIGLSRLGLKSGIVTAVGRDAFGDFLVGRLGSEKVDTSGVIRSRNRQTSATVVLVRPGGERSFLHVRGASADISDLDVPDSTLKRYRVLHVGGMLLMPRLDGKPAARLLRRAVRLGLKTSLDTCWDPGKRWRLVLPSLPWVDYFMPSFEEAREILKCPDPRGLISAAFAAGVRKAVILKKGAEGCWAAERGGEIIRVPALKVRAVDATGAGDAFDAGFLAGLLKGMKLESALKLGCAAGACCVTGPGAVGNLSSYGKTARAAGSLRISRPAK